jgi:hypothetical protein
MSLMFALSEAKGVVRARTHAHRFAQGVPPSRRGRCIGVLSREERMRPRSRCNGLFGLTTER